MQFLLLLNFLKKKKKTEWDKIIHNIDLKNVESSSGKDIARMK